MRPRRNKKIPTNRRCGACKQRSSVHKEVPRVLFRVNPGYPGRITRSITRALDHMKNFKLIEVYRCMPLLGDEHLVPNWDVHIVRYAVVFTGDTH